MMPDLGPDLNLVNALVHVIDSKLFLEARKQALIDMKQVTVEQEVGKLLGGKLIIKVVFDGK